MKRLVLLLLLIVPTLASAAEEVVWAVSETKSTRFSDRDVAGPTFGAGTKLEVLVREGDRLRVRDNDSFGWVSVAATTNMPPAEPSAFDPEMMREKLRAMGIDPSQMGGMPGAPGAPVPQVPTPVPSVPPPGQ